MPSQSDELCIESMQADDWPRVREIYQEGIATSDATFETRAPDWPGFDREHLPACRLVARRGPNLLGWAALSAVSGRPVYAGVAEVSVYVAEAARGQGVGRALLSRLIELSEQNGIWTLQAGIFRENRASLALHEDLEFRTIGVRERLGRMHGRWRDVVLLERRSVVAGGD